MIKFIDFIKNLDRKATIVTAVIAGVLLIGGLGYYAFSRALANSAASSDYCQGLTSTAWRDCTQNMDSWRNYLANHTNAKFAKMIKAWDKKANSNSDTSTPTPAPTVCPTPVAIGNWGTGQDVKSDYFLTNMPVAGIGSADTSITKLARIDLVYRDPNITGFGIQTWSESGSSWALISDTGNIWSQLFVGENQNINLAKPLTVKDGDYIAYYITLSGAAVNKPFEATTASANATYRLSDPSATPNTGIDWTKTSALSAYLPIQLAAGQTGLTFATPIITGNWGAGRATQARYFLSTDPSNIIQQTGAITNLDRIDLVYKDPNVKSFDVQVWRPNGTNTWSYVNESGNIWPKLNVGQNNNITINNINVKQGDYIGYYITMDGTNQEMGRPFEAVSTTATATYYLDNPTAKPGTGTPWATAGATTSSFYLPIQIGGNKPVFPTLPTSCVTLTTAIPSPVITTVSPTLEPATPTPAPTTPLPTPTVPAPADTTYTITPSVMMGGTITPDHPVIVKPGETETFVAKPDAQWMVTSWEFNGQVITTNNNTYTTPPIYANSSVSVNIGLTSGGS